MKRQNFEAYIFKLAMLSNNNIFGLGPDFEDLVCQYFITTTRLLDPLIWCIYHTF